MTGTPAVYNIPAGCPFADTLATALLADCKNEPEKLARYHILLPTRRACRTLRESFLRLTDGQPLLLPRLQPLGDVEEDELLLGQGGAEDAINIPPAIAPLQRQILLAKLITSLPETLVQGPDHALALANALGQLMDRVHTEGLDMTALPHLVPDELAEHWQITTRFLEILSHQWPQILTEHGVIDESERRTRLLRALAARWRKDPPDTPIIAAGSTGSIPATAELLSVIASLPQGVVILPGLDTTLDDDSWQAFDDTHPQATLKQLLTVLGIDDHKTVRPIQDLWPSLPPDDESLLARRKLGTAMMRPAATSASWTELVLDKSSKDSLFGLMRADCDTPQEEARLIALIMREALEDPRKTVALVTPDRELARRVATTCARWNITLDDSGGMALPDTRIGSFLRLTARACIENLKPVALFSLLRHELCRLGLPRDDFDKAVNVLELALRGPAPAPGFHGLQSCIDENDNDPDNPAHDLLARLQTILEPFLSLAKNKEQSFKDYLDIHIAACEKLATTCDMQGEEILWAGDDGEAAAQFLSTLREEADALPAVTADIYLAMLEHLMVNVTVRPSLPAHPRLFILGQLEARLIKADLIILGGLNEGVWPPDPGHDPFLSRPMMVDFGLPAPERRIGQAAHDFMQGFCSPHVILTRARRRDGAPTVPARWLQRFETILQAQNIDSALVTKPAQPYLDWARLMDVSAIQTPYDRPAPTPTRTLRPRQLSVTAIETWMRDPYSIYARYVLRLQRLDPLDMKPNAAARGTLLHTVIEKFLALCKTEIPDNAETLFLDLGYDEIARRHDAPGFWEFWRPRFERLAGWVIDHEQSWRTQAAPAQIEARGTLTLSGAHDDFTLTARADRIDRRTDGSYAIIDYKSGKNANHSKKRIESGAAPQLPLEALILQDGGFQDLPAAETSYLGYWILTGGREEGEIIKTDGDLSSVLQTCRAGLVDLIRTFDDEKTPYYSLPDPDKAPHFNDYEHLARVQEWAARDDEFEEAA